MSFRPKDDWVVFPSAKIKLGAWEIDASDGQLVRYTKIRCILNNIKTIFQNYYTYINFENDKIYKSPIKLLTLGLLIICLTHLYTFGRDLYNSL